MSEDPRDQDTAPVELPIPDEPPAEPEPHPDAFETETLKESDHGYGKDDEDD